MNLFKIKARTDKIDFFSHKYLKYLLFVSSKIILFWALDF